MNQVREANAKFIESACRMYSIPDAARPLVEGYLTILETQGHPMLEGAFLDRVKGLGKGLILPILAGVCIGTGTAQAAGTDLAKCNNLTQCAAEINDLKVSGKITPKDMKEVKRIAENRRSVEYCNVFPHGIMCKLENIVVDGVNLSGATFTPTKHIDGIPDEVNSIMFVTATDSSGSSKIMSFDAGRESKSFQAGTGMSGNFGVVKEDDGFAKKSEERYSYQSILDYINTIYELCKQ